MVRLPPVMVRVRFRVPAVRTRFPVPAVEFPAKIKVLLAPLMVPLPIVRLLATLTLVPLKDPLPIAVRVAPLEVGFAVKIVELLATVRTPLPLLVKVTDPLEVGFAVRITKFEFEVSVIALVESTPELSVRVPLVLRLGCTLKTPLERVSVAAEEFTDPEVRAMDPAFKRIPEFKVSVPAPVLMRFAALLRLSVPLNVFDPFKTRAPAEDDPFEVSCSSDKPSLIGKSDFTFVSARVFASTRGGEMIVAATTSVARTNRFRD